MSFLDNMLNGKISKEAANVPQGETKEAHEQNKLAANEWIADLTSIDVEAVEKEHNDKLAEEARMLGKEAESRECPKCSHAQFLHKGPQCDVPECSCRVEKKASLEKQASEEFKTEEQVVESDYNRQVKSYSDYNLTEMLALARAHKDNVTAEMYNEYKEKAKKDVSSSRKESENELIKLTGSHTLLDWKAAFDKFTKDAKVEEAKEADLYQPKAPEKAHNFEDPADDKFKVPSDEKKADVMIGVGREADERKDVTMEAGVPQDDITKGLGKVASQNDDGHQHNWGRLVDPKNPDGDAYCVECNMRKSDFEKQASTEKKADHEGFKNYETWSVALYLDNDRTFADEVRGAVTSIKSQGDFALWLKEFIESQKPNLGANMWDDLLNAALSNVDWMEVAEHETAHHSEAAKTTGMTKTASCPVCGGEGKDLNNKEKDHLSCMACGITYGDESMKSAASKEEVIKKVAELSKKAEVESPWIVVEKDGQEMIARRDITNLQKESDENNDDLKK